MILKTVGIVYLFDFDGTLFGGNHWVSFWNNSLQCLKKGPYINPNDYDIRWYILTGRPLLDKLFVWYTCHSKGLHPLKIFTQPAYLYPKNFTSINVYDFKLQFIKNLFDRKIKLKEHEKIDKLFYIDNDLDCISYLNSRRLNYPFQAISGVDFKAENFNLFL